MVYSNRRRERGLINKNMTKPRSLALVVLNRKFVICDALAILQLDDVTSGFGRFTQSRALGIVPGLKPRGRVTGVTVIDRLRQQVISARGDIFEIEAAVVARAGLRVPQYIVSSLFLGGNQMRPDFALELAVLTGDHLTFHRRRAFGDRYSDSSQFFPRLERDAVSRDVDRGWRRGSARAGSRRLAFHDDCADVPVFIRQLR